jgi:hypothetical protein
MERPSPLISLAHSFSHYLKIAGEYMYSHQRKNPTTGANDITGKNQNANINIYMGCEKSVGKWGGVNTKGEKIKQNGSFMRTIIKDDSSTVGLIDLALHQVCPNTHTMEP